MATHVESQMRRAEKLINAGRKREALELLRPLTESNSDVAKLWWLVACSASKPETQRKALEKALRLQPNFPEARRMLDLVKAQSPEDATDAKLKTVELLQAETTNARPSGMARVLRMALFLLVAVVMGVAGYIILQQQLNTDTPDIPSPQTEAQPAVSGTTNAPDAEVTPEDSRIQVQTEMPFSFVLPEGECWSYLENDTGGLFTCRVDNALLFSGSLNTPYVIDAMNAPQEYQLIFGSRTVTVYEGNPFPGNAGGDALWLTTELDGKTASLLAVTSADAPSDTLDPYKEELYHMLLSVLWE